MSQTDIVLIAVLSFLCMIMLKVVIYIWWRQRVRLQENQARIANLQGMLKEQYEHRVDSIRVIVNAMDEDQCEYAEGCIRLKMLLDQIAPELLQQPEYAIIETMYKETEHMPIKEDWKQLDKKVKAKLTNERFALEGKHKEAIAAAVKALRKHQFDDFDTLTAKAEAQTEAS